MTRLKIHIICAIFGLLLSSGCAATKSVTPAGAYPPDGHTPYKHPENFSPAKHLVFIGLDGWGGAYVSKANMPAVKRMMANGASCPDMRCVMPSNSWPNWTSLFSGTPPENRNSQNFPEIFTLVKNSGNENTPVLFHEWGDLHEICPDEAAEKQSIASDLESAQKIAAYIVENKPVFIAAIFNEPDSIGHAKRWGSLAYYAKLAEMDVLVAVIEQAVMDSGFYDDTVFVLSADHGGVLWGHGFNSSTQRKIPLIICGRGIKKGYEIPSRTSICDIAPTMAAILGLETPPEWTGRILGEIFE